MAKGKLWIVYETHPCSFDPCCSFDCAFCYPPKVPREPHAALIAELEWCRDYGSGGARTEEALIAAIAALKGEC